jgi:hypothetical protein
MLRRRSQTYTHKFRPLTEQELSGLCAHLIRSGTGYSALLSFLRGHKQKEGWHRGEWTIPLPDQREAASPDDRYYRLKK